MDPKTALLSFTLDIGIDQNAEPETVQPFGDRPRVVSSVNTRLTVTRGRVTKAPARTTLGAGLRRCGGIVPSRAYDSAVAFFHTADGGNRRITRGVVGLLSALNISTNDQSSYYPLRIARAGALPSGAAAVVGPAVGHDPSTGYTYYATLGDTISAGATVSFIAITVLGANGQLVCSPKRVVVYGASIANPFLAITAFSGQVTLWYKSTATNAILAARLTVSGTVVSLGAATTIYTPGSIAMGSAALAYDQADTSNVYIVCFQAASNNARLLRVNPTTFAVSTGLDVATGADAAAKHAIAYVHDGTSGQLIWMVSWAAGNCTLFAANTTTLATSWSQTNRLWWADEGSISCGFYKQAFPIAINAAVFAATRQGSVASAATPGGTAVEARVYAGGALFVSSTIPWYQMVSQICTVKIESSTQFYPVFTMSPYYDLAGRDDPTAAGFISDPSVDLMRMRYDTGGPVAYFDLIGRVGTDIVTRYPGTPLGVNSSVFVLSDQKMRLVYVADNVDGVNRGGLVTRYVDIDWTPSNPRQALLAGGQAVIAAAQPACWDGAEITEFQPVRAPKIVASASGGTGDVLTGTYLFAAVISWRDGSGYVHRSPPSEIITVSPVGAAIRLWVTVPVTYENRATQGPYTVTIYASQASGTVLYAQSTAETVASSTAYWHAFLTVFDPIQNALTPALYSDGSATQIKIPFAPNAARDAKVIGDRLWLLDAERNRAYYSQPLSTEALAGVFPAMNPTQYVYFPAAAGTVVALENWKEAPLFFSSTGVWTVDGEGPDALNNPPFFAQPRQLSDLPCTDGDSVVLTPAGVMFRSGNRFAVAGDAFGVLDDVSASVDVSGVVVFRDQHEVVVILVDGTALVYNFLKKAWTTWDANAFSSSGAISAAVQDPWTGKALYFSDSATALFSMDPTTTSTTAQMSISTGWVIPGNPQEDVTLQNWILRAAHGGSHGVDLTIATDYQANQPTKSYSTADITGATTNSRYDLNAEPRDMPARAVKLTIAETGATGAGMQPLNVTYELIRNTGKRAAAIRNTARK
jgi:hypothetical protein